jgi:proteasome lid subunit RPN8/RPN11
MRAERFEKVSAQLLCTVRRALLREPALEHCGVLVGSPGGDVLESAVLYPGPLGERRFRLPQSWLLQIFYQQRRAGREIAGFFHTHPPGQSLEPSPADRAGHPPGSLVLLVGEREHACYRVGVDDSGWTLLDLVCL